MSETLGWSDFVVGSYVISEGKTYIVIGRDPNNSAHLRLKDAQGKIWSIHNCFCESLEEDDVIHMGRS